MVRKKIKEPTFSLALECVSCFWTKIINSRGGSLFAQDMCYQIASKRDLNQDQKQG